MNRWKVLALLCIVGIWILAIGGCDDKSISDQVAKVDYSYIPWKDKGGSIELQSEPAPQMSYFVVDGNTIDLGHESHRWHRVLFFNKQGLLIGSFTKNEDLEPSDTSSPRHTKRYIDGFTELWCDDVRITSCGGSANFELTDCRVCGMYVQTTGISPETDRIYETNREMYSMDPNGGGA